MAVDVEQDAIANLKLLYQRDTTINYLYSRITLKDEEIADKKSEIEYYKSEIAALKNHIVQAAEDCMKSLKKSKWKTFWKQFKIAIVAAVIGALAVLFSV